MNWKEEFLKEHLEARRKETPNQLIRFIETEIIEKLIEDIPDEMFDKYSSKGYAELHRLKQKLRDKWLNN